MIGFNKRVNYKNYKELQKPTWAPPSWVFGPVWSLLYTLIIFTFGYVLLKYVQGEIIFMILLPFILNIVFNLLFTPIQFGLRNNYLASLDIALVLGTLLWLMPAIFPHYPLVAILNIPYLLWVCFASALQFTVTYLNK